MCDLGLSHSATETVERCTAPCWQPSTKKWSVLHVLFLSFLNWFVDISYHKSRGYLLLQSIFDCISDMTYCDMMFVCFFFPAISLFSRQEILSLIVLAVQGLGWMDTWIIVNSLNFLSRFVASWLNPWPELVWTAQQPGFQHATRRQIQIFPSSDPLSQRFCSCRHVQPSLLPSCLVSSSYPVFASKLSSSYPTLWNAHIIPAVEDAYFYESSI